jgi:hypothetical protein
VPNQLPTQAFTLRPEQIAALQQLGKQDGRRSASQALREILDRDPEVRALIDAERERQPRDRIAS